MRVLLRILAVLIGFSTFLQLMVIWRVWRFDGFGELLATGLFAWVTIFSWLLFLLLAPFAVVQLWRLRESGRKSTLFLAGFTVVYYVGGALFFRQAGVHVPQVLRPAIPGMVITVLLFSGPGRRAFSK